MGERRPVIGITSDVIETGVTGSDARVVRHATGSGYVERIIRAGGTPLVLPTRIEALDEHLRLCDGFVLVGGDDPAMEPFGGVTHPRATVMDADRQAYEVGLLRELEKRAGEGGGGEGGVPCLGVCLGMQLMALVAGGDLDQYLPESVETHAAHWGHVEHGVELVVDDGVFAEVLGDVFARDGEGGRGESNAGRRKGVGGVVDSHHKQAVRDAGRMRVAVRSDDGVIEAIDDPSRRFHVGVQWHAERPPDAPVNQYLFTRLVEEIKKKG